MPKILVLDANQRSALAAIRSLGKITGVSVFAADSVAESIGGSSRYCQQYLQCPSAEKQPEAFLSWIQDSINSHQIDMVFPSTEISSQLLLMHADVLGDARLPFASYETVMALADKGKLMTLAKSCGVPCPDSVQYENAGQINPEQITTYPIVIKPCLSRIWLGHKWLNTEVQIAFDQPQLIAFLNETPWLQEHPFMLQQFVSGYGAGLFAIYNQGEPVAFFAHQRIREKPPEGGVSVVSKSVALDPKLLENTKKLLNATKWHGVAMVEFRVSNDGTPYLMEVNTRFWGSMQLAIDAGVDFPTILYKISNNEAVPAQQDYKQDIRLRWLLGDLDSLYLVLKSSRFSVKEKLLRVITFFIPRFFSTHHQVGRLSDFKPGITELKQYVSDLRN